MKIRKIKSRNVSRASAFRKWAITTANDAIKAYQELLDANPNIIGAYQQLRAWKQIKSYFN